MTESDYIAKNEGFANRPYKCPAGKWTVGYGRNFEDQPLTPAEILELFRRINWAQPEYAEDWAKILLENILKSLRHKLNIHLPFTVSLSGPRKMVIVDMAYNLGVDGLLKFYKMRAALEKRQYDLSAVEMLDSKYLFDTKTRAVQNAKYMCEDWAKVKKDLGKRNPKALEVVMQYGG